MFSDNKLFNSPDNPDRYIYIYHDFPVITLYFITQEQKGVIMMELARLGVLKQLQISLRALVDWILSEG